MFDTYTDELTGRTIKVSRKLREVCFLIDKTGRIIWSDSSDNAGYLNDSNDRWKAISENRHVLGVVAHSHPCGPAHFSSVDESTIRALNLALGPFSPLYAVVSPLGTRVWDGYAENPSVLPWSIEPFWANQLRERSGMIPSVMCCPACQEIGSINMRIGEGKITESCGCGWNHSIELRDNKEG